MSTARTTSDTTASAAPTDLPVWDIEAEELEAMLATDDDTVDTAVIPRLAFREAVEEAAAPGTAAVTTVAEPSPEPVVAPAGQRHRHATPESLAAVRRNLIAMACVLTAVVLIGAAATWLAGWIALGIWTFVVAAGAIALHRVNARYTARHSRYTPRHV